MIPKNINKEHILLAIKDIEKNGLRYKLGESSVYDLSYEGKKYPPKHVIVVANEYANGELLSHTELTTDVAQRFLKKLGPEFQIEQKNSDPVKKMIEDYKEDLIEKGLSDETYKWEMLGTFHGRPDTDAADFGKEIREIDYRNLVYHNGIAVRNHIVLENGERYRDAFRLLFDEQIPLSERIIEFQVKILSIYRSMGEKLHHHHDERSIATFLTVKYPTGYGFYKNSFYTKYCKLLGVKTKKKNEKYVHYLELLDNFVEGYLKNDHELLELVAQRLPEDAYGDTNHKLLAQDILYKMLDKNAPTFNGIIEDLKEVIADEDSMLRDFTFDNSNYKDGGLNGKKVSYIWIRDPLRKIGNLNAHYEVSIRTRGNFKNSFFVDIHFEGKDKRKYHKLIGDVLPEELEWISWQDEKSIGYKNGIEPTDDDVVEKIMEQLLYLENNIADRVRAVIPLVYNEMDDKNQTTSFEALNQILYGPPGTGKTYHTIDKALKIIDPKFYQANERNRNALTRRFKDLLIKDFDNTSGQIAFCTFHQSMAYEDFIEGIKPVAPKGTEDAVNYRVADGLFKRLCLEAAKTKSISGFEESYEKFINDVVENDNTLVLRTPIRDKPFNIRINSNHNVVSIPQTANATEMVVTKKMVMHYMMEGIVDDWSSYTIALSNYINKNFPFTVANQDNSKKNYVLIIDEINRGNVSQIFGELITLIEDNKRAGKKEELEIILPYSANSFTVPQNLYIIGTMNTADRSVEALDTALRRRFSFEEMRSKPELLSPQRLIWQFWWAYEEKPWNDPEFMQKESTFYRLLDAQELIAMTSDQKEVLWNKMQGGTDETVFSTYPFTQAFDFRGFLEKINARLEKLLSSDHSIGHSYLMSVYSMDDLMTVIYNKVIPLLQEYFYGDLGKIGLVLGQGFIRVKKQLEKELFAEFDYDTDMLNEKDIYEILDYRNNNSYDIEIHKKKTVVTFTLAIELLMGKKIILDE